MSTCTQADGFILINKTINHSSNHIVQKVKRLLGAQKAGHTGTLDPFADGLMIITLGHATKVSQFLLDAHKSYRAVLQFGVQTDSGDLTGKPINISTQHPTKKQLLEIIPNFIGAQLQTPPMFSALKSNGKALYEYAKQGISIERKPRPIDVLSMTLLNFDASLNQATLDIECSKGTYIRTLAEDIVKACGGLAHLIKLTRTSQFITTKNGRSTLTLTDALDLDQLNQIPKSERQNYIRPTGLLINHLPIIALSEQEYKRWLCGQRLRLALSAAENNPCLTSEVSTTYAIYFEDRLIGIGTKIGDILHPERLLIDPLRASEVLK